MGVIDPIDYEALSKNKNHEEIMDLIFTTEKYRLDPTYQPKRGSSALTDSYGNPRKIDNADGVLYGDFRLPTEAEWEYAANGMPVDRTGAGKRFAPWDGTGYDNIPKDAKGNPIPFANYMRKNGDMMGVAGNSNDGGDIPVPVFSYPPNDFGLYNMSGNVNEWVADVYRSSTSEIVNPHNPFRGNQFKREW